MANDHWPLFDLEVRTPRLGLRYLDDRLAERLLAVAAAGVHDPATMPFSIPWTDLPSPEMEREAMRFYWTSRAGTRPESWRLLFAVIVDGTVIGACDLFASDFPTLRQFETGSWLGREFQGRGLGKEMRLAALTLGFDGLGAEIATTGLWHDNAASLGVTQSLGYEESGRRRARRRDAPDELISFRMFRSHWDTLRRDDITLHGVDAARDFLGVRPRSDPGAS
jgi:RimJ/RimL family protein N-acetyltransferase